MNHGGRVSQKDCIGGGRECKLTRKSSHVYTPCMVGRSVRTAHHPDTHPDTPIPSCLMRSSQQPLNEVGFLALGVEILGFQHLLQLIHLGQQELHGVRMEPWA